MNTADETFARHQIRATHKIGKQNVPSFWRQHTENHLGGAVLSIEMSSTNRSNCEGGGKRRVTQGAGGNHVDRDRG